MTKITFPPMPEYAPAFRPRWASDVGGFSAAQMHARDLEVARVVMEAAAKICDDPTHKEHFCNCADYIREIEVSHE